ncbi:hypothetical protein X976_1967 [Burkholderia pseudomallei MSHR7500]|nr:hypothetical protein X976_1967 [Burkholderia pseudomallei MSHR7500]
MHPIFTTVANEYSVIQQEPSTILEGACLGSIYVKAIDGTLACLPHVRPRFGNMSKSNTSLTDTFK